MRPHAHGPRVKICGIASRPEAAIATAHGASALSLVSHTPSGLGVVDDDIVAHVIANVPPHVTHEPMVSVPPDAKSRRNSCPSGGWAARAQRG